MQRSSFACLLAILALGACGERAPVPSACIEAQPADVTQALSAAPDPVTLADGTPLSRCVARTIDQAQLQALGATLTGAAAELSRRMRAGDAAAALQLGYLIGATVRGADEAAWFQGELADRIAGVADGGPHPAAVQRGRAAGKRHG